MDDCDDESDDSDLPGSYDDANEETHVDDSRKKFSTSNIEEEQATSGDTDVSVVRWSKRTTKVMANPAYLKKR